MLVNYGGHYCRLLIQLRARFTQSARRFYRSVETTLVVSRSLLAHLKSVALVLCNIVLVTFKTSDYRLAQKDGRSSDSPRGKANCLCVAYLNQENAMKKK